jgi:hypothetical protein
MAHAMRIALTCAALLLLFTGRPAAGQATIRTGWVGIFTTELVEWLENGNRLAELCGTEDKDFAAFHRCRTEKMATKAHLVRLWSGPSISSRPAGSLVLLASPTDGLQALYAGIDGGPATAFQPDLYDGDWGYGPTFHMTIVEQRGSWVRLPETPFPKETWFDVRALGPEPDFVWLEPERIVTSPLGDLFIIAIENGVIRARLEQERDMWCEGGDQPAAAPATEFRLSHDDTYTPAGHLRLHIKYTRGC